jgi:hypothetical protein
MRLPAFASFVAGVPSLIVLPYFTNRISPSKESTHGMAF